MADYQDLFNEQLRRVQDSAGERVEARGGTGWETVVVSHHTIRVRHGDDVPVEVIKTPRGPVISRTPDGGALSLRFPAAVEGRLGFESLLPLLRSRNVDDVEAALGAWVEPVNSVIAGDSSGSVRHLVAGLVPARNPENRRLPVPAWEPAYSGKPAPSRNQEYVPLASATVNGFAVSANDRASGGGDAIAMEFAPAHRALRIRTLLEAAEGPVGVETMQAIHMDTGLGPWPLFRSLAANTAPGILSPRSISPADRTAGLGWPDGCRQPTGVSLRCLAGARWCSGLLHTRHWRGWTGPPGTRRSLARGCPWHPGWVSHWRRCCSEANRWGSTSRRRWSLLWRLPPKQLPLRDGANGISCSPSMTFQYHWPAQRQPHPSAETPVACSAPKAFPEWTTAASGAPWPATSGTWLTVPTAAGSFLSAPQGRQGQALYRSVAALDRRPTEPRDDRLVPVNQSLTTRTPGKNLKET